MYTKFLAIILLSVFLSGCAGMGYVITPRPEAGTYHKVQKGETLWHISKFYGTEIDRIASANRLPNKEKIYVGQRLFIPGVVGQAELPNPGLLEKRSFTWPVKGRVISFYGNIEDSIKNKGIDIKARKGTSVLASRGGIVSYCDENMKGFGKTIIIDHGDGFSTVYAYNSQILVETGDRVSKKAVIAKVGTTGRATSPQLHFEVRKNKVAKNPFYYLP